MKLKNSYILLIAMSLFLLISIGSVCATDNGTTDANLLSDDGWNIILSDDGDANTNQEKINTTVESQNVLLPENDPVEIPVTVKDNESNPIAVTQNNITVTEGNNTLNFSYNNSKLNIVDKLAVGNHSLIISYLGNDVYKNSTTNIILSIFGNKTLEVPSVVNTDGTIVEIPVVLTDGVNKYAITENDIKLNLTYVDENGNASYMMIDSFTVENNAARFLLNDLKFTSASITLNCTADETELSKKIALKLATTVIAENAKFNETDNKTIPISVLFGENQLNVTKNDLKVIENNADLAFEYNNSAITINSLAYGNHTITIKFIGNDTYGESSKDILVSVYGNVTINAVSAIDVNSTKKGEIKIMNITNGVDIFKFDLSDLNITASYKSGNDTIMLNVKVLKLENSTLFVEFENLNFTTATLTINYKNGTALTNVTINRIYNARIVVLTGQNQYLNSAFKFKLEDIDDNTVVISGKTISLYTVGNIRAGFSATTDKDGIAQFYTKNLYEFDNTGGSLTMKQFEVGNHTVEISTSGNVKTSKITVNLTITQAEVNIVISNFKEEYGTNKNVTITVTNKKNGEPVP